MRNIGYVVKTGPGVAEVLLGRHAQCVRCGGCLAAADDTQRAVKVSNEVSAAVGARVEIEVSPGRLVGAAFVLFMLPVFAALAGGYAGYRLAVALGGPPALIGVGLGALAFVASFLILRAMNKSGHRSALPSIVRILAEDETEGGC